MNAYTYDSKQNTSNTSNIYQYINDNLKGINYIHLVHPHVAMQVNDQYKIIVYLTYIVNY